MRNYNQYLSFEAINDDQFLKTYKSKLTLYFLIKSCVIRKKHDWDFLNIQRKYWKNGYLACSKSYSWLAKKLDCSKSTVIKWVKELEEDGAVIIKCVNLGNKKKQNVYVLGTHNGAPRPDYRESYFLDNKFQNKQEKSSIKNSVADDLENSFYDNLHQPLVRKLWQP
jgi:hypothetical protein